MNHYVNRMLSILIIVLITMSVSACHHDRRSRHADFKTSEKLSSYIEKELNLDPNQKIQLDNMLIILNKNKMLDAKDELKDIFIGQLKNEEINQSLLKLEVNKHIREFENTSLKFIANLDFFHSSLTADQRGKLLSMLDDHESKKHHMN